MGTIRVLFLLLSLSIVHAQVRSLSRLFLDSEENDDINDTLFDDGARTITIFSNFDNSADRRFFNTTLPWIVDNIGHDIRINYRFSNSGRSAGPRMCILRAMRRNAYMQSEFLRCEANGSSFSTCLDQAPIQRRTYNRCVNRRVNDYMRDSQLDFANLIADNTPIILLNGRREVSTANPARLFREICQRYSRTRRPTGCIRPSAFPNE